MFLPIHDDNPLKIIRFQTIAGIIIVLNFLVFFYSHIGVGGKGEMALALSYGTIPAIFTNNASLELYLQKVPEAVTLITYMFLHSGWMHIIANMAFIWVFADNVEDAFGHFGFLLFYLTTGIIAALTHIAISPQSQAPLIGASGAVSGIMAAYLVLFPKARVWILLFLKIPMPIPAFWALLAWFGFQFVSLLSATGDAANVAWWAHIGGFISGLVITIPLKNRLARRFARNIVS